MSQVSGARPNVTGIEKRFFQLEADHHSAGETAWSAPSLAKLLEPGRKRPPLRQASSARAVSSDGASQLIPTIGITTIVQATSWLQPSDSFSVSERTSNWTWPVPSASVKAAISAGGKAAPTAASGGMCAE